MHSFSLETDFRLCRRWMSIMQLMSVSNLILFACTVVWIEVNKMMHSLKKVVGTASMRATIVWRSSKRKQSLMIEWSFEPKWTQWYAVEFRVLSGVCCIPRVRARGQCSSFAHRTWMNENEIVTSSFYGHHVHIQSKLICQFYDNAILRKLTGTQACPWSSAGVSQVRSFTLRLIYKSVEPFSIVTL